ncbi:MAG: S-layer homology domain-containing protein [Burkholderiales bacterium]|nr:S-layer homology domain-containing protein [Burkholderiales bacterium]GIK87354.1 MAG: hypothetical protein BroJett026_28350 [Betaproteobacteria bacterium]
MKCSPRAAWLPLAALCVALPASADPCAGASPFSDVAPGDSFCSDATWAKNANITVGCTIGVFCPSDPVTRAQMVLFLRRMAEATFPAAILTESSAAPSGDLDTTGVAACTTANVPAPGLNEHASHVVAVVSLLGGATGADVQVAVSRSANGGGFVPASTVNPILSVPAGQWVNGSVMAPAVPMLVGSTYRWRIDLARAAGSATTGELAGMRCQLKVFRSMEPVPPS